MAAIAITGMLMTGALVAVGNLVQSEKRIEASEPAASRLAGLDVILTADLLHASEYSADEKGQWLALRTQASLAAADMELEHVRSEVRYEVRRIDGRCWLVRRQQTGIDQPQAELVCPDVEAIGIRDAPARSAQVPLGALWKEVPCQAAATIQPAGGELQTLVVQRR